MTGGRRCIIGTLAVATIMAGSCGGDSGDGDSDRPQTTTTAAAPPTNTVADATAADDATAAERRADIEERLAQDPMVVFSALPAKPDHIDYEIPTGMHDFDQLWEPGAPWRAALEHVDFYRIHAFQIRHYLTDAQLLDLIEFLAKHDLGLMLETEPLQPVDPGVCDHTESYEGPWDLEMAARFKELGGHIDVIAIEQPYHYGYLLNSPGACQYDIERVVDEVMIHVDGLRQLFGAIPVGTIEGLWSAPPPTRADDYAHWLDSFEELAGEKFAFVHVDVEWYRPDWVEVLLGIEAIADERNVPFGVLYNGGLAHGSERWMQSMMENIAEFEIEHGGTPQHVAIQTWVNFPDRALPETDLGALTSGVVRYFADRTTVSVEPDGAGGAVAMVTDANGAPVEGATITVATLPIDRGVSTQTILGRVPDGVSEALVLLRANNEETETGVVDASIIDISYVEAGTTESVVPNGEFAGGLTSWGAYGDNPGQWRSVPHSGGQALRLTATAEQDIFVDGAAFAVTPGADYSFTTTYEVATDSQDNVTVSLAFVGVRRDNIWLRHTATDQGEVLTDSNGRAVISPDLMRQFAPTEVFVSHAGDLEHWPGNASVRIG